ncbi:META domain-containing protein [Ramlibacter sp. G-1-2-2]|uniref:META domain-containing protein n=1 Tax=Ramlibacter agri TaxID=2728837 RepID=A0A848H8N0_9BURK|nr:META domain-containing protein [Ramlibacter agri]NML47135.1 META domain-containing protein [Ramlibacter agri]
MPKHSTLHSVALLLALAGCAGTPSAPSTVAAADNSWPLAGTFWQLAEVGGTRVETPPSRIAPFLVLQSADQQAKGFGGCNRFDGGYALDGAALRFQPPGGTRHDCAGGTAQEQAFLQALAATASWRQDGDRLQLLAADGKPVAAFNASAQRYVCDGSKMMFVHAEPREAVLAMDGRVYSMEDAPVASGVRYLAAEGRSPGYSLEWLTKDGSEGLLVEAPQSDARSMADQRTVARCKRS